MLIHVKIRQYIQRKISLYTKTSNQINNIKSFNYLIKTHLNMHLILLNTQYAMYTVISLR